MVGGEMVVIRTPEGSVQVETQRRARTGERWPAARAGAQERQR